MDIEIKQQDGVCVMDLSGEVKLGEPTKLLRQKSRQLVDSGESSFVIDMLDVPWLDSSGIGEVFACYKRAREKDGVVKLVLRDKSYSLFTLTQLDKVFEIFEQVDDAVASFESPRGVSEPSDG